MSFFGAKGGNIRFSKDGVSISKEGERKDFISCEALIKKCTINKGMFFASLEFEADKGEIIFDGLPKMVAEEAYLLLKKQWYLYIYEDVKAMSSKLMTCLLMDRYLRTSEWDDLQKQARKELHSFIEVPHEGLLDAKHRKPFEIIQRISEMDNSDLEKIRNKYIEKCKKKFDGFFSEIESNPLTDDQRNACIVDEENNLVLASAGTGKTSTMVGRAGFLVASQQAKDSEILMLAFARKTAEEMKERINGRLDSCDVEVSTFHKLGKQIIASVEGASPGVSRFAEDEKLLAKQISDWVNEMLQEKSYRAKILKYFERYLYVEQNPFSFKTEGEYFKYLESNDIRTFKGEKVKGHGERIIANFLFRMGVEYQYEPSYEYKTRTLEFRQYKPDFYLPKLKLYIEHFGIDQHGNTAPYIDREMYHRSMDWKRSLHKENGTDLVETYFYEHIDGSLIPKLNEKLLAREVVFNPLPDEAVLETLREFGEVSRFSALMADFLTHYKACCFDDASLNKRISSSPHQKHVLAALDLLKPILEKYQRVLDEDQEIDFNDMIGKALTYVKSGAFSHSWKYIMVDEFQDISDPRARLVKALKNSSSNCSLFCVGDDWQAIYRFTGSDINFTTGYSDYFGPTKITVLGNTFRFNNKISKLASDFIGKNPFQTKKTISTFSQVDSPAVSLLRQSKFTPEGRFTPLQRCLEKIHQLSKDTSVLVLARYNHILPEQIEINQLKLNFPGLDISRQSIHGSKGNEADYVIILGLESGKWGFPSEKVGNPLLEALLPSLEKFPFAEERRLFYVALTRARKRVYLVADMTIASKFVVELIDEDYELAMDEFQVERSQIEYKKIRCIRCETGVMQSRVGKHGAFYGCSNFPFCDYSENGCSSCGQPMTRIERDDLRNGGYKVCIDPACNSWVPLCPICKGDMVQIPSKFDGNKFWGCRNWRPGKQRSCNYKENVIYGPSLK